MWRWRIFLVVLSAGLQIAIFPIHGPLPMGRSWLAWFALTPLLLAILAPDRKGRAVSPLRAALLGYLCGVVWYAGDCSWIYQTMYLYGGMGKPMAALILVLFSLYLGLYHALFGWLLRLSAGKNGTRTGMALLASPFLWVAVELTRARVTSFPWDQLGMSQIDMGWIAALVQRAGVYVVSFALALVSALLAVMVFSILRWRVVAGVLLAIGVLLAMLSPLRITEVFHAPYPTAVLLQPNAALNDDMKWQGTGYEKNLQRFDVLSEHPPLGPQNFGVADIIVWPESPSPLFEQDARFQTEAAVLAKDTGSPLILGNVGRGIVAGQSVVYNSASFFTAQGTPAGRYDKIHLVPFGEYVPLKALFSFAGGLTQNVGTMTPGRQRVMFSTGGHTYGVFICYESIFADEVRLLAKNGADVLVNISDDGWYGDTAAPWQHLNMARMRAIENHRWLLRDTNTGVTAAIDPWGNIVASAPRHTLTAIRVPFAFVSGTTFYTRHGDWFAWMCCVVAFGMLCFAFASRHESRHSAASTES